jgi:hypothetical protein
MSVPEEDAVDASGQELYKAISRAYQEKIDPQVRSGMIGAKEASLFLLRAGIDGIRYPEGSLSGKGTTSKNMNYVVFDESAVTIDEHIQFSLSDKEADEWFDEFQKKWIKEKEALLDIQESGEPITEQDYAENRKNIGITRKITQPFRTAGKETKKEVSRLIAPISTRLDRINPKLKHKVRKLDFDISTKYNKDINPFLLLYKKAKKMSRNDAADWDYARKNSDVAKIGELIEKYNMINEYTKVREVLKSIREEALDTGLSFGEIEEYWPRVLKDSEGFLTAIGKGTDWPIYSNALKDKAIELEISVSEMDTDMKANIISNMILSGEGPAGIGGISGTKKRKLKKIPVELNKYYMQSDVAVETYVRQLRSVIEKRKFFGKIPEKVGKIRMELFATQAKIRKLNKQLRETPDEKVEKQRNELIGNEKQLRAYLDKYAAQRDYTANIGAFIDELVTNKEIDPSHERELDEILHARFHERGTHGFFQLYKNLSYIDTMGSPVSALTQIGDLAWSMHNAGIIPALKQAVKSIPPKKYKKINVTREDVGVAHIAQEFADPGSLSKMVSMVFKLVGLEKIDAIGKESLLNSALEKYQKQAQKAPVTLSAEIEPIFGSETQSVIDDLINNRITDNIKLLTYNRLADFQPVGMSEVPERYLTSGNGRIFYMLKTFTIKQFDAFRNEAFHKMRVGNKREKIEGLKNLITLSMAFVLLNAGADELKDWLLGRKTDLSDRLVDNVLRLFGVSKFITWKARTEGVGSAAARQVLPPFKFIDSISKDIYNAGDDKGLEIVSSIPLLGKLAYWHIGRGVSKREDLWNIRWRKYKSGLKKINEQYLRSENKRIFRQKHGRKLREYERVNKKQSYLNDYRKRINLLKSRKKTPVIEKKIKNLENKRTELIKKWLKK